MHVPFKSSQQWSKVISVNFNMYGSAARPGQAQEEEVDIETGVDIDTNLDARQNGEVDEESAWAEDEPDDDVAEWKMKLIMEETQGV